MAIDLEQLQDSPHLLDILIQMEDVLDSMDVYVFKNWLKGEVVEGPIIHRYWVDMTLRYPYREMPDPKAALRLLKHDVRVDFEKARYEADSAGMGNSPNAGDPITTEESNDEEDRVWLVRISIPRRLINQISAVQHDFYDDEIDADDVEDAKDVGMDDEESGFTEDTLSDQENADADTDEGQPLEPNGLAPQQGGRK